MQIGSLVVLKKCDIHPTTLPYIQWLPVMDEETVYTVRNLNEKAIIFEEGIIGINPFTDCEIGFPIEYAREVQPPQDVQTFVERCQPMELA